MITASAAHTRARALPHPSFPNPQVLSACAVSFSHGANDIANSIGSFTAAYNTYATLQACGAARGAAVWTRFSWVWVQGSQDPGPRMDRD
jgi:phosphate/sulfate permease